jgi:hypothetical protein
VCRIKLGRSQEAERDLEGFLAAAPMGLYRGEAMWVLGDVALQERWDAKAAKKRYEQALDWCGRVRALKEGARLYAVPEKAAEPAKAPAAWQKMQPSGVIERERISPARWSIASRPRGTSTASRPSSATASASSSRSPATGRRQWNTGGR